MGIPTDIEGAPPEPDELDKEQIDQLHVAVLQISSNCFELKKLCATALVAGGTLIATFTDKRLDTSVFVGALIVVLLFWVADSQSYYFQAKLRRRMKQLQQNRIKRYPSLVASYAVDGVGLPVTSSGGRFLWVVQAFINASMLYYALIALVIALTWSLFAASLIE